MTEITTSKVALDGLEEAEDMLATLTTAKIKGEARLREVNEVRAELAYSGLSAAGTASDRKKLVEATEQAILLGAELDNLSFAIVTAKKRVDEARKLCGTEGVRLKAEDGLRHVAAWRQHGDRAAGLFRQFIEEYDLAMAAATAIKRLKLIRAAPESEILELGLKRALQKHLFRRRLHPEPLLTPLASQRDLDEVVEFWAVQMENGLDRVLSGEAAPPVEPPMELPEREWIEGEQFLDPDPVDQAAE